MFGLEGKNRKIPHSTQASKQDGFLPEITTKLDGRTYPAGSYRITITIRRVMPLTANMPTSPQMTSVSTTAANISTEGAQLDLFNAVQQGENNTTNKC